MTQKVESYECLEIHVFYGIFAYVQVFWNVEYIEIIFTQGITEKALYAISRQDDSRDIDPHVHCIYNDAGILGHFFFTGGCWKMNTGSSANIVLCAHEEPMAFSYLTC